MRLSTPNNILLSIWQILLEMFVFWSESVTRFLPGQDGPDPQGAPQHDQYSSVCGKDDKDHDRNLINLISGRSRGGRNNQFLDASWRVHGRFSIDSQKLKIDLSIFYLSSVFSCVLLRTACISANVQKVVAQCVEMQAAYSSIALGYAALSPISGRFCDRRSLILIFDWEQLFL